MSEEYRAHDEAAQTAFNEGRLVESFELNSELLRDLRLPERERPRVEANRDLALLAMEAAVLLGAPQRRRLLSDRAPIAEPEVTLTVTTCRRLELFVRSMDSFLVACTDIERIGRFVCIDDGSSEADRDAMRERYPFFEFIMKSEADRGHARSMNILRETVRSKYWLHLEDDFQFFERRPMIAEACAIFAEESDVMQVLFNRGYAEDMRDRNVDSGELRISANGMRYWVHLYLPDSEPAKPGHRHLRKWPHFSFRPSLMRTEKIHHLGCFDESPIHFELDFAERYTAHGYRSAFLDTICSLHIGRLLEERDAGLIPNAYQLNGQPQYGDNEPVQIRVTVAILVGTPALLDAISITIGSLREQCEDLDSVGACICASDSAPSDALVSQMQFMRFVPGGFQSLLTETNSRYMLYVTAGQTFADRFSITRAIERLLESHSKVVPFGDSVAILAPNSEGPSEPCLLEVLSFRPPSAGARAPVSVSKRAFPQIPAQAEWQPKSSEWLVCNRDDRGAFHGSLRWYRESGALALACEFEHGLRHGPFERYYPSTAVSQRGRYFLGHLDGLLTKFSEDATSRTYEEFRAGVSLASDYTAIWPRPLRDRETDVLRISFDFWPAHEPVLGPVQGEEVTVEQSAEALRAAIARAAQRVQACRLLALARGHSDPAPDVSRLASAEPAQKSSFTTAQGETVQVDETLVIAEPTERDLMLRARLEWVTLCWLCWAAGLNSVDAPSRLSPRPEFHGALAAVAARLAQLQAFEPGPAQYFHRLNEAELPASAFAILTQYYREVRAVLLFAGDSECRSPWQDDLGRQEGS